MPPWKMYNETLSFLEMMEKSLKKRPYVLSLSLPKDYPLIGRIEKDPALLRKGAEDGKMAVFLALREKCGFARRSQDFDSLRSLAGKNS